MRIINFLEPVFTATGNGNQLLIPPRYEGLHLVTDCFTDLKSGQIIQLTENSRISYLNHGSLDFGLGMLALLEKGSSVVVENPITKEYYTTVVKNDFVIRLVVTDYIIKCKLHVRARIELPRNSIFIIDRQRFLTKNEYTRITTLKDSYVMINSYGKLLDNVPIMFKFNKTESQISL